MGLMRSFEGSPVRITDEEESPAQEVVAESVQQPEQLVRITDEEEPGSTVESVNEAKVYSGDELAEIRGAIPQESQEASKESQLAGLRQELTEAQEAPADQSEKLAQLDAKAAEYDTVKRYQEVKGIQDSQENWANVQAALREKMGIVGNEQYSDEQLRDQLARDEAKQQTFGSKVRNSGFVRGVLGFFKGRPSGLMFSEEVTRAGSFRNEIAQRERQRADKEAQDAEIAHLEGKLAEMPHAAPARQEDGSFSTQTLDSQYRFSGGFSGAAHSADRIRQEQGERQSA